MRYNLLRRSAATLAIALALVGTSLPASAAKAKKKASRPPAVAKPRITGIPRYTLTYSLKYYSGRMEFVGKIIDTRTGNVIASPGFSFAGTLRTTGTAAGGIEWILDVTPQSRSTGTATLSVRSNGREIERSTYALVTPAAAPMRNYDYDGEPISIAFRNADLRDVLMTFSALTKVQFVIDPDVKARVTMNIENTPWDEALARVIAEAGYQSTREGNKVHVHK